MFRRRRAYRAALRGWAEGQADALDHELPFKLTRKKIARGDHTTVSGLNYGDGLPLDVWSLCFAEAMRG